MRTVTHDGRKTAYRETRFADEPTVLYIHGAGGTHQVWARQYGDRGDLRTVALDLSGHGDSEDVDVSAGPETLNAYANDVVSVAEATGATVLCGNSMGGAVALWVALEHDLELEGIVLCDTGAKLGVDPGFMKLLRTDFDGAVDALHEPGTLFYEPTDEIVEPSKAGLRENGSAVTVRDFETCETFDVRDRLGEVDVPSLAICGEHDPLTPPSFHEYLERELPDCAFVQVPDASHMPMLEKPARFNDHVRSFLRSL